MELNITFVWLKITSGIIRFSVIFKCSKPLILNLILDKSLEIQVLNMLDG